MASSPRGGGPVNARWGAGTTDVVSVLDICGGCRVTNLLLPTSMLARRGDFAALIGRALELKAAGLGQRPIAATIGVARSTVRGWVSRFASVAVQVRAHLVRWALWFDPGLVRIEPSGSGFGDAIAAIAARAARPPAGLGSAAGGSSLCVSLR